MVPGSSRIFAVNPRIHVLWADSLWSTLRTSYWKWPIDIFIVDLPMTNDDFFHSFFVNVYQRVDLMFREFRGFAVLSDGLFAH